jgi:hypothetical protein
LCVFIEQLSHISKKKIKNSNSSTVIKKEKRNLCGIGLAKDRNRWRALVNSVLNL